MRPRMVQHVNTGQLVTLMHFLVEVKKNRRSRFDRVNKKVTIQMQVPTTAANKVVEQHFLMKMATKSPVFAQTHFDLPRSGPQRILLFGPWMKQFPVHRWIGSQEPPRYFWGSFHLHWEPEKRIYFFAHLTGMQAAETYSNTNLTLIEN